MGSSVAILQSEVLDMPPTDKMFRQVTWLIPKHLMERIEACHTWAQQNMKGVPDGMNDFAQALLWDGMRKFEDMILAWKRQNSLIVVPEFVHKDKPIEIKL